MQWPIAGPGRPPTSGLFAAMTRYEDYCCRCDAYLQPYDLSSYLRKNIYDNIEEFWVLLREKGSKKATLVKEEKHHESAAAPRPNFLLLKQKQIN